MRGFWGKEHWALDGDALRMPNGQRITLKAILQWQHDQTIGNIDLSGKWPGWRVRQQWLIAPGGTMRRGKIANHVLRQLMTFSEWDHSDVSRRQLSLF